VVALRGEMGQILLDIYLDSSGVSPVTGTVGLSAGNPDVTQERVFVEYMRSNPTFTLSLLKEQFNCVDFVKWNLTLTLLSPWFL
jgi:hypothetical protein